MIGESGRGTVYCCFLWPLYDSLVMENDCSGNDGADKLFWGIKNFCYVLVAVKFFSHFIGKCKGKHVSVSVYVRSRTNPGIYTPGERARI